MEPLQAADESNHLKGDDPILQCYQATFKSHLEALLKEIDLEMIEKRNLLKAKKEERKHLGARLYEEQERLIQLQEKLRALNTQYEELLFQCQEGQKQLINVQKKYEKCKVDLKIEEKTEMDLMQQLEKLNCEVNDLIKFGQDTSSHCSIMQTVNQKSEKDKDRLSVEHFEQDLRIHQYMKTLNRLREEINHNKRILQVQKEEANELREQIAEAEVDIKAIHVDFKQLLAQWKNSLLALSKRDEALASIKSVLRNHQIWNGMTKQQDELNQISLALSTLICCTVFHIWWFCAQLTGVAVFGVGLWTVVTKDSYFSILSTSTYAATAYILITAGAIVFLVSILGCVALWNEDRCCLLAYTFLLLLIFLLEAVAGVIAYIYEEQVWSELQNTLNSTFIANYKYDISLTEAIDDLQRRYKCCGAAGYKDWRQSRWLQDNPEIENKAPDSCCITESQFCGYSSNPSNIYHQGCATALSEHIKDNLTILGAVGLGICLVQIIGMIFSCCLYVQLRDYDRGYY